MAFHPGVVVALQRFGADELGVARLMAADELTSPQRYENILLVAMRITGTGYAYRKALDEFVWRDPSIYLNAEFLARCNGLPVILEHPKKAVLDGKEFKNRIIGTVFLPYLNGNEVWGIVKVYDEGAARLILEGQLSTSPSVVFRDPDVNTKIATDNGQTLLIEGKPSLLDHLAVCEKGVWDKGGPPEGVRTDAQEFVRADSTGDSAMAEEDKKVEEKKDTAKADAGGEKLDKLLSHMDALKGHMDSVSKMCDSVSRRMDAFEEDKKKADAAKADAEKMKDAKKDGEKGADDKPAPSMAADKRKDAKKDGEEEDKKEEKREDKRKDAAKKDGEEEGKKEEKKEEKDDSAKADSELSGLKKRLADLESRQPKQMSDDDHATLSSAQAKADSVYNLHGKRAPRPLDGETVRAYRNRIARELQPYSAKLKDVKLLAVADDVAFSTLENLIYADAESAANNPTDLREDELREIVRVNPVTRGHIVEFKGKRTFIHGMNPNKNFVTAFHVDQSRRPQ